MAGTSKAVFIFGLVLAAGAGLVWIGLNELMSNPRLPEPTKSAPTRDDLLKRGAFLMNAMACADCHSPHDQKGQPIPGREFSGHPADAPLPEWDPSLLQRNIAVTIDPTFTAFAGPFGTSVAPNLTPDKETGIGNTRAEDLIRSWHTGLHWKENRPILPPMPAPHYGVLSDDDVRAIHAFLMSLPPVKNSVPPSKPSLAPSASGR